MTRFIFSFFSFLLNKLRILKITCTSEGKNKTQNFDGKKIIKLHDTFRHEFYDIEVTVMQRAVIASDLTIVLNTIKGETYQIQTSSAETVCMLKCRIQFKYDISVDMQVFLSRGILLNDERKLGEYGISNNSTVLLRLQHKVEKPVIRLRFQMSMFIYNWIIFGNF